jgi:hypothetical protein
MTGQAMTDQPGWHRDPAGRFDSRYWDGSRWTSAVMRNGQVDTDPCEPTPAMDGIGSTSATGVGESGSATGAAPAASIGPQPATFAAGWTATDRFTSLAPAEAHARIMQLLPLGGITLTGNSPGRLSAQVSAAEEPNWIVVVALCFLWLLPGLIYWYVKSRPVAHPLVVQLLPAELGTRIALQGDAVALERIAPVLAQLPW